MKTLFTLFILTFSVLSIAQESNDVNRLFQLDPRADIGFYNDCWGFKDTANGTEYAIFGSRQSTLVYDITSETEEPRLVTEIFLAGSSTWRDFKSYKNVVYGCADSPNRTGLFVIDLNDTSNIVSHSYNPMVQTEFGPATINGAHNVFIDEDGYLYVSGSTGFRGGEGIAVFDLNQDPYFPPQVGFVPTGYSHDVFVQDGLMATSDIEVGQLRLFNVEQKDSIFFYDGVTTSSNFTHNCWLSDDGNYAFTTDERSRAFIDAYDISDPTNIEFISSFRTAGGTNGALPHNVHYHNGYLVTSYYSQGLVVIDVSEPEVMTEVAFFRTSNSPIGLGCWGAFPYLPSGRVLASDMTNGLHILEVNYQRAAYIRGNVTDSASTDPIVDATIRILNDRDNRQFTSDQAGAFQFGMDDDSIKIEISTEGYRTETMTIATPRGEWTELDIQLVANNNVTSVDEEESPKSSNILITNLIKSGESLRIKNNVNIEQFSHIKIINNQGQIMAQFDQLGSSHIGTENLPSGIYYLNARLNRNERAVQKFTIQ